MTDKQRAVIQNWLEMCRARTVKVADQLLTEKQCLILELAIRAIAGDLEVAGA